MVAPEGLGSVERSLVIPLPREGLWDLLSRPAELSRWFGAEVTELDLRPGGRIGFRSPDGRVRGARLETVEPPERLAFRWLDGDEPASTVELLLEEVAEGGTRLTIVESLVSLEPDPVPGELLQEGGPIRTGDPPPDPPEAPPRILLHA
jgi:uncharacterized protein YndB with AHSA1/START domain